MSQTIFVRLIENYQALELLFVAYHIRGAEEHPTLGVAEVVRQDVLLLALRILVGQVNPRQYALDVFVLLDHLEGGHGAEAADRRRVVAAAQDAEVNELCVAHLERLEDLGELDLADRLLL